jgi:phosphopentomutase
VIDAFVSATGCEGVLGNEAISGTTVIAKRGDEHARTGWPIVYTSADSVFQIAAHKDVIPLDDLYRLCAIARTEVCVGEHAVGRVIARPFVGESGAYTRVSAERRDFARPPHRPPLQQVLQEHGVRTIAIGKIGDLFANVGFDAIRKTRSDEVGMQETLDAIQDYARNPQPTFVWTNLVEFDQAYGHRNDPQGFARALEAFDRFLPTLRAALPEEAALVLTADHGNDPTTASTDHAREYVPLLFDPPGRTRAGISLGLRASFNDHAATVANAFGVPFETRGVPFRT